MLHREWHRYETDDIDPEPPEKDRVLAFRKESRWQIAQFQKLGSYREREQRWSPQEFTAKPKS